MQRTGVRPAGPTSRGTMAQVVVATRVSAARALPARGPGLPSRRVSPTPRRLARVQALAGDGSGVPPGGGDGGGGGGGDGGDAGDWEGNLPDENSDNAELVDLRSAEARAKRAGVNLPADFLAEASGAGLRASALASYLSLASGSGFLTAFLLRSFPIVRDRLLLDPRFLFKVGVEVVIDSGCATIAEVRKRGEHFWDEFDFYLSDIMVGIVLDAVLVTLLAPKAVVGAHRKSAAMPGILGKLKRLSDRVPSAVFAKAAPGMPAYSVGDRVLGFFVKGLEYALAGTICGLVGQGVTNGAMMAKRAILREPAPAHGEGMPSIWMTSLVWGLFMGTSSNYRYQVVFGLERVLEGLPLARRVPAILNVGSVAIRFTNNVIGGEQFIDMARWAGVQ